MRLWLASAVDRARSSLFFLPMLAVLAAIAAGFGSVWVDSRLDDVTQLPLVLSSTVDSAREILSTIAAATISFAGIAFSIALLVIQLTSSQYSPRVVHTLFRDPFNRRVMALVVGTFTYCVVVLRTVRSSLDEGGESIIPNLSVAIALVLGISSILATVAFINHSAHTMDVSELLQRATSETITQIRRTWVEPSDESADPPQPLKLEPARHVTRFQEHGWLQQLDLDALEDLVPTGGYIELHSHPGRFTVPGTAICSTSGAINDTEEFDQSVRSAIAVGPSRTMQQDATYGLRQIVDVAVRAMSPGVNDPTTAQDAIFHMAAVLTEMLRHDPPPTVRPTANGGQLLLPEAPSHRDVVALALDEIRRSSSGHPTVCVYLLQAISLVREALDAEGRHEQAELLVHHAVLIVRGSGHSDSLPADHELVQQAFDDRFAAPGATA